MATAVEYRAVNLPVSPPTPPPTHLSLSTATFEPPSQRYLNTRLPYCSPGPIPGSRKLPSPPESPTKQSSTSPLARSSLLHDPDGRYEACSRAPDVYSLSGAQLAEALEYAATRPLPDASDVFPWMHGLTADNQMQLSFFRGLSKSPIPDVPKCLRAVTIVKAAGNLTSSRLKGAISPDELLVPTETCKGRHAVHCEGGPCFLDVDPKRGFSIRNFKIQCCKMATTSDIVVYGDDSTPRCEVEALATLLSKAQATWQAKLDKFETEGSKTFHTFVLKDSFASVETAHPEIVHCFSDGSKSDTLTDFSTQERREMLSLSEASEIGHNVFLGPTPDWVANNDLNANKGPHFDILVEASDYARLPERQTLDQVESFFKKHKAGERVCAQVDCPSSGSFACRSSFSEDAEGIISLCRWIYEMANGEDDHANVQEMSEDGLLVPVDPRNQASQRRILIHCNDGYTESTVLGLCYFMYTECLTANEAWIRLHKDKKRNFFAYPTDRQFLEQIQRRLMAESPSLHKNIAPTTVPAWFRRMDGSLPSRILPYLYLGNLNHANNTGMLKELGISHVLSVGERATWPSEPSVDGEDSTTWPDEKFLYIDQVQDNGVDPLTKDFARCLSFIEKAKARGEATLVHCRVGVSRSATICIAEVMQSLGLSLPRAYCFVRARRLNVIIQPHLRFTYELLKWEEHQCEKRGEVLRREQEWASIAREIAILNKPYCRD